ncbi:hypothetical protein EV126DRAFT_171990 [Verticillium dahliae]|nr:hypothetical protein EV126DRAFT_171990 [Verticillium dahliae]
MGGVGGVVVGVGGNSSAAWRRRNWRRCTQVPSLQYLPTCQNVWQGRWRQVQVQVEAEARSKCWEMPEGEGEEDERKEQANASSRVGPGLLPKGRSVQEVPFKRRRTESPAAVVVSPREPASLTVINPLLTKTAEGRAGQGGRGAGGGFREDRGDCRQLEQGTHAAVALQLPSLLSFVVAQSSKRRAAIEICARPMSNRLSAGSGPCNVVETSRQRKDATNSS